jgi:hypothetical protein
MGAPHAGQLVAFELIAWPQSLHVVSLRFANVGTCRTVAKENTGGGSGGGGTRSMLLLGISICPLQLGQFTVIPAPLSSMERCSLQRGQLKRMSMLQRSGLSGAREDREFCWPCRPPSNQIVPARTKERERQSSPIIFWGRKFLRERGVLTSF